MKRIIFVCFFISLFKLTFSQNFNIDKVSGKILYTEVIMVDSVSKEKIYSKVKEWFAINFKSANDVIQLDDKDNFTIIGKGAIQVTLMSANAGVVRFTIKIQAKDNKYKYEITDLVHDAKTAKRPEMQGGNLENIKPDCGVFFMIKGQWSNIKTQADTQVQLLIQSLKINISSTKTESDW